jgi:adenylate cyclase
MPVPDSEMTCSPQELQRVAYADAGERIEVLSALPGVIRYAPSAEELEKRVVDVLLRGIPRATTAAVVRQVARPGGPDVEVRAVQWRGTGGETFRPSRRLVSAAMDRLRQGVVHIWGLGATGPDSVTLDPSYDWALCVPLFDAPSQGWGLYVAGRLDRTDPIGQSPADRDRLKSDMKFAELVGEIFSSLRQVLDLQHRHSLLTRFLSRPVLAAIADNDMEEVLKARETEVTVLFCDLRGSCRLAEKGQCHLQQLWDQVSEALNIMSSCILDQDGVIGDFQGDAAMGFWGWPLACPDRVERAARAALMIRRRFAHAAQQADNAVADFSCGIGIASGPAIAGKLGTMDQFKVDVFGPTVNLASRLESMTKMFRVPILIDEHTADELTRTGSSTFARCRRVARVQPYGMESTHLTVSELLPPAVESGSLSEMKRKDYEAGLDAFLEGRWEDAPVLLRRLPGDGPANYLLSFMDSYQKLVPTGWDGVIRLESK